MSIRYARQEALWGEEGQRKLAQAHVAVIGAGGLGSPALLYLAGAGVGRISLFDDDVVSPSNLHRQVIHTTAAIGTPKTDSDAATVRALNPEVDITCHGRLESATAMKQLRGCDLILDGTDNFDARYLSSWAAHELGIPHEKINVHGGATALGHPIGASGTRIITTLIAALQRHGKKRGIASLCIGGGEATAVAIELV